MSCLMNLYETYEANKDFVGKIDYMHSGQSFTLLPVSHTTQTAHIEVAVTEDGSFHTAHVIDKNDRDTIIPCTEDSASRAGAVIAPYPLHDKLSYVAGDFVSYGGKIKDKDHEPFSSYINNLKKWAESPFTTSQVKSIYTYLSKRLLIKDLVAEKILWLDENGQLITKWNDKYKALCGDKKPDIFSSVASGQDSAFVRFTIYSKGKSLQKVWLDKEMYDSFTHFYNEQLSERDLCFVSGQWLPATEKHANKIRNAGDKAKLISANDTSGFTYRGRFNESHEAASISYEVSQKAHNALKWLIRRQARIVDNRVFLVWSIHNDKVINPEDDIYDISHLSAEMEDPSAYTNSEFANQFKKAMDGYRNKLDPNAKVNILILDSATTGRLAILYYRSMQQNVYLQRLADWHSQCVWQHDYRKGKDKQLLAYFGAPATKDIAYAAYGSKASDKVVKGLMERMLPCIVDEKRVPKDIVHSTFYRARNPVAIDRWEWEKTLSIACALINRQEYENNNGRGFTVALDEQNIDRNYLFGRLLAIADVLEHRALKSEDWRLSNATRYMNEFSEHPERTWKTIQSSLVPYQARLGHGGLYLTQLIDDVAAKISYQDFDNQPLTGKFLLGFYSQRHQLYQKKKDADSVTETN
ncbi:type I-C CRISPR-associated protein Cas8c/Csd1 [Sporolactobacillus pectinivorans]|uniref:type I-C CRISPR-associated protein Cas8c/Csd1 n=1 Tax=Sporolactobacillus pectinivorans TaxID=1591408 RepID=UPI000C2675E3|nr:type I-C CRISPR-associated protein Cas8c/Csd1 [Sporolactobacillus pectinivorans]